MGSVPLQEGTRAPSAGHGEKAAIGSPGRAPSAGAGGGGRAANRGKCGSLSRPVCDPLLRQLN